MSEASRETTPTVQPFTKITFSPPPPVTFGDPDSKAKPVVPFVKMGSASDHAPVADPTDDWEVADPKDESAVASVASLESQHPNPRPVSEIPVQTPSATTTEPSTVVATDSTKVKENDPSSPSSSSETSPGWSMPPAPVAPPTSENNPKP